jgi:hypothetical protein
MFKAIADEVRPFFPYLGQTRNDACAFSKLHPIIRGILVISGPNTLGIIKFS